MVASPPESSQPGDSIPDIVGNVPSPKTDLALFLGEEKEFDGKHH